VTPVTLAARKAVGESPPAEAYGWMGDVERQRAVVRILALPRSRSTGRELFRADFIRMRLLRDGEEVPPIHPGRTLHPVRAWVGGGMLEDEAVLGTYEYPPEAFRPGGRLTLEVFRAAAPDVPHRKEIPASLQQHIWEDFQPFFQALHEQTQTPRGESCSRQAGPTGMDAAAR
jgi:hypothetical protein